MRFFLIRVLLVTSMLARAAPALLAAAEKEPSAADTQQRIRRVAEMVHARKMLREHAAGKITLSEPDLKRFQAVARGIRRTDPENPSSARARRPFVVRLADPDLETVAGAIKIYSGKPVSIAPDVPRPVTSMRLEADSAEEMLLLLEEELNRAGYRTVEVDGGLRLEAIVPSSTGNPGTK